jgi:hypothetical protein
MLKRQAAGRVLPIFVGGKPVTTATTLKVYDKFNKQVKSFSCKLPSCMHECEITLAGAGGL